MVGNLKSLVRSLAAILALVVAVCLILIYYFWPVTNDSHRLHRLVIDCVPDALIALIAIPVAYWLFLRRGFLPSGEQLTDGARSFPEVTDESHSMMRVIPEEIKNASIDPDDVPALTPSGESKSILIVVDIQEDFVSGSLKAHDAHKIIKPLNSAIRMAQERKIITVFTKDWHPPDHCSFKEHGGPWASHCVQDTLGAQLVKDLHVPPGSLIIEFGVEAGTRGYSPLENSGFEALLESQAIDNVFVAGIALEYCVQATCLGAVRKGKRVVALERLIATAGENQDEIEMVWSKLQEQGVQREKRHAVLAEY